MAMNRRRFLNTAALGSAAVWLTEFRLQAKPSLTEDRLAALRDFMSATLAEAPYLIPGVVVMIGTPEETLFHEAVGLAQVVPKEIPMRPDTVFDIASIGKVVTATACALCVDRGLLDPDAPMPRYLPDHKGKGIERITLRHLAAHISGYPNAPRVASFGKGKALFQGVLRMSPSWPVDTKYHYSCANATTLGIVVERVTGLTFGEFCAREIFQPLGMKDTTYNTTPHVDRAAGTDVEPGIAHSGDVMAAGRAIGAGCAFTTAPDLASLCRMMLREGLHNGGRFLSAEVIRDFTRDIIRDRGLELEGERGGAPSRGFLWATGDEPYRPGRLSPRAYGHGGWTGTALWIDPEKQLFALMLGNRIHPKDLGFESRIPQYNKLARIADQVLDKLGI
jgi:CubicO group peptidase (beta-lactamase class C family)